MECRFFGSHVVASTLGFVSGERARLAQVLRWKDRVLPRGFDMNRVALSASSGEVVNNARRAIGMKQSQSFELLGEVEEGSALLSPSVKSF